MPVDWSKYPSDWKQIANGVKAATDWKCQVCGKQCYTPFEKVVDTRNVLTVAHINHVEADCREENLVAACSVCHLKYDAVRRRWQRLARERIENHG
jgi:5-methylcytosine-specific restriction endonuclease McrA